MPALLSRVPWSVALVTGAALAQTSAALAQTSASVEERIGRIQNGLLPPVVVQGAMHVPGVSIAMIHGGKIE